MNVNPKKKLLEGVIFKFNQNDFKGALSDIQNVIKKFPYSELSYNILGSIEMAMNELEKASEAFKKAISLKKDYYHAINNLGLVFYKKKDYDEAIFYFKKASNFDKDYTAPFLNLSAVYIDRYMLKDAQSILEKLIILNPNMHEAYYNLSKTFIKMGQTNLAIDNLNKAISIDSRQLNYLKDLGNIYLQKGEQKIGLNYLKDYLKIFPNSTEVYFYISLLKKYKEVDKIFEPFFSIDENKLSEDKKIYLFFTYGKIFCDMNNIKKSFLYYKKANAIKDKQHPFDMQNELKLLPILRQHFKNEAFKKNNSLKKEINKNGTPIFIVGMPRSGTSLVDQILSKHPNIDALGELEFLGNEINNLNLINSKYSTEKANLLRNKYISNLVKINLKSIYFTDKTPINFRWIGYIFDSFPNAKVIHIERKPQAVCWSNFKSNFNGKANNFANSLENIVEYYMNYKKIMNFYNSLYKEKIFNITYENLIDNFEINVRKLISYLNLKWDRNCLNFYDSNRYVSTTSFAQVKKKIFFNSSKEWEKFSTHLDQYFNVFK